MSVSRGHSMGEVGLTFVSLLLIVAIVNLLATVAIPPLVTFLSPSPDSDALHGERQ
jgi:Tfp pilus assembly protein PilE